MKPASVSPNAKERSSIKTTSGYTTKELLFDKPSDCTINLDPGNNVDDDGDNWRSIVLPQ